MKPVLFVVILLINACHSVAQDSVKKLLAYSGYLETYYSYDFNKPSGHDRPGFFYSHNRHNEFNLNLGFLKIACENNRARAAISLATGTYMNANYAAEPGVLKNIYEANAGVKLVPDKNLWLDAGIFSSHIGFESAVSKDCPVLTRSIVAENTPFFEAGARITFTSKNSKWLLAALALNGWQRITRVNGNSMMSAGLQIQYRPSDATTINYSNFIGTDQPDSTRKIRVYHNLYAIFHPALKWTVTAAIDMGMEQKDRGSSRMNTLYSPVLILQYAAGNKWTVAARGELYHDPQGIIINSGTAHGFQTRGLSVNADYSPVANAVVRVELRTLRAKDPLFVKGAALSDTDSFITSSLALNF